MGSGKIPGPLPTACADVVLRTRMRINNRIPSPEIPVLVLLCKGKLKTSLRLHRFRLIPTTSVPMVLFRCNTEGNLYKWNNWISSQESLVGFHGKVEQEKLPKPTPVRSESDVRMVATCRIYKKSCPNGKVTLYLPKREYIDHITSVDPIDGIVLLDDDYLKQRHVYGHVIATFRYGREDDEVMGLKFVKELYLASEQIYPPPQDEPRPAVSKTVERLKDKLGPNAYPFTLKLPDNAPHSVMLQPGEDEQGQPCGIYYEVRITVGNTQHDKGHKRNSVSMAVRKVQRALLVGSRQPCSVIKKDFLLSPGHLELEVTLDKQVFEHGDPVAVNIAVRNYANKTVKRIKVYAIQNADICMFANGHCRTIISVLDTESGCPIGPGGTMHKVVEIFPTVAEALTTRGVALDAPVGDEMAVMASSTILPEDQEKDPFGIIVSYSIKVKLILGALGGEVVSELPFVLMNSGAKKMTNYLTSDHPTTKYVRF